MVRNGNHDMKMTEYGDMKGKHVDVTVSLAPI